MAVISPTLQAFLTAALALSGLSLAQAEDDEISLQYSHYEEGQRHLLDSYKTLKLEPIHVDSWSASESITIKDRIKLGFSFNQDTWSGATPLTTAPAAAMYLLQSGASSAISENFFIDKRNRPYRIDFNTGNVALDKRTVHMMSSASAETRHQAELKLGYEWDETRVNLGGGVSLEPDYQSYFINNSAQFDFNHKLSTLNLGWSYNDSTIKAQRAMQYMGYIDYSSQANPLDNSPIRGQRQDLSFKLGWSQVLTKNSVLETGLAYSNSTGFLENPYKVAEFIFVDPNYQPDPVGSPYAGLMQAQTQGVLERRPNSRQQWTFNTRLVQYISAVDAALHVDYRFFHDDWGINAHTFEASWGQPLGQAWTLTPRIRYYSQEAASFYQPYFVFGQALPRTQQGSFDFSQLALANFSSDQRLSAYGALSGGVTLSKEFAKGIRFDASFEYYSHQGSLKLGGGGENHYADFDYYLLNASLQVNLAKAFAHDGHNQHKHTTMHRHGVAIPAGIMAGHVLDHAGDVMLGYRYGYSNQTGQLLHGSHSVNDGVIVKRACSSRGCSMTPTAMTMNMHMFDLMYAPTDWLSLMLMPQVMDMSMTMRNLDGGVVDTSGDMMGMNRASSMKHSTGGLGDTGLYALFKVFNHGSQHLHASLGLSAPTGDVAVKSAVGGKLVDYGMQLGSGTWDLLPSLTYTGQVQNWSWGAQLSGIKRLQQRNASGFALGDKFQATTWGGFKLFNWLSASVRGIYTRQLELSGHYHKANSQTSSVDFPANYGGSYWDIGLGLNASASSGIFAGQQLAFEWLQPLATEVNGFQLNRDNAFNITWQIGF